MATEILLNDLDTKFCADNLLTSEDWDTGLYSYGDVSDDYGELFPSGFNSFPLHLYDSQMDVESCSVSSSQDENHSVNLSDLLVKAEPASPFSSSSCDSSSSCEGLYTPSLGGVGTSVKVELPPSPPCPTLEPPATPCGTLQITLLPVSPTTATAGCLPKSNSFLSKKPALQPRPAPGTKPTPTSSSAPHAIILHPVTSSAPAKPTLTASPSVLVPQLLTVQNGATTTSPIKSEAKTIVPAPSTGKSSPTEVDPKFLKRQQRMIKNRESACQSRRKKKEYVQGLEARLQETERQLENARRENRELRETVQHLMRENATLRGSSGNRKVVCVMVVLLFLAFNFGPTSLIHSVQEESVKSPEISSNVRHLLSYKTEDKPSKPPQPKLYMSRPTKPKSTYSNSSRSLANVEHLMVHDLDQLFLASDCRHFNRTESLRLADELSLWIRRHQNERKTGKHTLKKQRKKRNPQVRSNVGLSDLIPAQMSRIQSHRIANTPLQLYGPQEHNDNFLMDAIERREDTFYVVSFRRDHLLLPAISHNKTSRPKMSLVMPALPVNDSVYNNSQGYETMMQIDCEVMDTRVIQIKSSTVPPSLRTPHSPPPQQGASRGNLSLYLQDQTSPDDGQN
ncbi:cyclic AMP-dependent transcription factor ATF-6 beta isoform X2 [Lithobates pipiens]